MVAPPPLPRRPRPPAALQPSLPDLSPGSCRLRPSPGLRPCSGAGEGGRLGLRGAGDWVWRTWRALRSGGPGRDLSSEAASLLAAAAARARRAEAFRAAADGTCGAVSPRPRGHFLWGACHHGPRALARALRIPACPPFSLDVGLLRATRVPRCARVPPSGMLSDGCAGLCLPFPHAHQVVSCLGPFRDAAVSNRVAVLVWARAFSPLR